MDCEDPFFLDTLLQLTVPRWQYLGLVLTGYNKNFRKAYGFP